MELGMFWVHSHGWTRILVDLKFQKVQAIYQSGPRQREKKRRQNFGGEKQTFGPLHVGHFSFSVSCFLYHILVNRHQKIAILKYKCSISWPFLPVVSYPATMMTKAVAKTSSSLRALLLLGGFSTESDAAVGYNLASLSNWSSSPCSEPDMI